MAQPSIVRDAATEHADRAMISICRLVNSATYLPAPAPTTPPTPPASLPAPYTRLGMSVNQVSSVEWVKWVKNETESRQVY